jgi:hypothetical protein
MTVKVTIPEDSRQQLENVLRDTMLFRGRNPERLVMKAAGYVASFAYGKIPVADAAKILAELKRPVTNSSKLYRRNKSGRRVRVKRGRNAQEWAGTLAAVLVASIHTWGNRNKTSRRLMENALKRIGAPGTRRGLSAAAFYAAVKAFAGTRKGSAGYLRSGMIPAMRLYAASKGARSAFKHPPGRAMLTTGSTRITARTENIAAGIDKVAPNVLRTAEREVAVIFEEWLREAHEEAARKTGQLTTT